MRLLLAHDADAYVGDTFTAADAIARLKLDEDVALLPGRPMSKPCSLSRRSQRLAAAALHPRCGHQQPQCRRRQGRARALARAAVPTAAPGGGTEAQALPPSQCQGDRSGAADGREAGRGGDTQAGSSNWEAAQVDEQSADELAAQWPALSRIAAAADAEAQKIEDPRERERCECDAGLARVAAGARYGRRPRGLLSTSSATIC